MTPAERKVVEAARDAMHEAFIELETSYPHLSDRLDNSADALDKLLRDSERERVIFDEDLHGGSVVPWEHGKRHRVSVIEQEPGEAGNAVSDQPKLKPCPFASCAGIPPRRLGGRGRGKVECPNCGTCRHESEWNDRAVEAELAAIANVALHHYQQYLEWAEDGDSPEMGEINENFARLRELGYPEESG